ncbi:trehalose-phosphatase [Lysobacter sp. D1-1-M9]|uniref:trehalose-phosphatase n=1 Tax=Novilysobacter longmucuonensis TaxID=3098603 RepID=UPI002FC73CF9
MSAPTPPLPPPPPPALDWALFLDVDGTLLEFAQKPDEVRVSPDLLDSIGALHERLDGALALVSGRSLAQLDALFAPLHLPATGLHGLERRDSTRPTPIPAPLKTLRREAESVIARFPGAVVEDKGATMALHWRGNRHAEPRLRALADAALAWLPGYRVQPGDHVVEVRPAGADKGAAITRMLGAAPFRGRKPVFVGDDHTDEDGFAVVLELGGLAVIVGDRRPTAAGHSLADPAAVGAWLSAAARVTTP